MSQHHSRTQEIIDTTLELLESRGVARLTTAALARRLGFTEAALYRYYSGKSAILAAALQHVAEAVFVSMGAELASGGAQPMMTERLAAHVREFSTHQGVLLDLLLAGATSHSGELQEAGNAFLEEYFWRLAGAFERAAETGLIASDARPRELASMWICQLLGGFLRSRLTVTAWNPEQHDGYRMFLHRIAAETPQPA